MKKITLKQIGKRLSRISGFPCLETYLDAELTENSGILARFTIQAADAKNDKALAITISIPDPGSSTSFTKGCLRIHNTSGKTIKGLDDPWGMLIGNTSDTAELMLDGEKLDALRSRVNKEMLAQLEESPGRITKKTLWQWHAVLKKTSK